jgi:hypothetical protein
MNVFTLITNPTAVPNGSSGANALTVKRPFQHPARVVRVLRVSEPGIGAHSAGRMVMSGRLADVCAELDRLAA